MSKCKSFAPSINNNCEVLILGSMPGIKSLEEQEYYAHPQNRFWKVMGHVCSVDKLNEEPYETKLSSLLKNNIALWDVIESCSRNGSLDSAIENEKPNKINELLNKYKNIKTIVLNGNKSYSAFKKHFPDILKEYKCLKMPSTSPANAKYSLKNLVDEWEKAF